MLSGRVGHGPIVTLVGIPGGTPVSALVGALVSALVGALVGALIGALIGALRYGGRAYLQHHLLRLLLIHTGCLPRRLVPFLDYATQRIFLRRVGGGYLFIHRLLLDYFAAQYTGPETGAAAGSATR